MDMDRMIDSLNERQLKMVLRTLLDQYPEAQDSFAGLYKALSEKDKSALGRYWAPLGDLLDEFKDSVLYLDGYEDEWTDYDEEYQHSLEFERRFYLLSQSLLAYCSSQENLEVDPAISAEVEETALGFIESRQDDLTEEYIDEFGQILCCLLDEDGKCRAADRFSSFDYSFWYRTAADLYISAKAYDKAIALIEDKAKDYEDLASLIGCYEALGQGDEGIAKAGQLILTLGRIYNSSDSAEVLDLVFSRMKGDKSALALYLEKSLASANKAAVLPYLATAFAELGDYDREKKAREELVCCSNADAVLENYKSLASMLHEEDKETSLDAILPRVKSACEEAHCILCIETGHLKEALDDILHPSRMNLYYDYCEYDREEKYSEQLADAFPKEIYSYWFARAVNRTKDAKSKLYEGAVRFLVKAKKLALSQGLEEQWNSDFCQYCAQHSRKSSLNALMRRAHLI